MRYRPSRGGHAPGHLRDAFEESAPGNYPIAGPRELDLEQLVGEDVFYDGPRTLRWLIGQLNCTDTMLLWGRKYPVSGWEFGKFHTHAVFSPAIRTIRFPSGLN